MTTTMAVVNHSTVVTDDDVRGMAAAIQAQITDDWKPLWGSSAIVRFYSKRQPPAGAWVTSIFDDADQANALGYHDVTPDGLPLSKVFAKTTLSDHGLVSVTFSHEALEMLGDPGINIQTEVEHADGSSRVYAYEVCDPVEADELGYQKTGAHGVVTVSDFVLPSYFQAFTKPGSRVAFKTQLPGPFTLARGGYLSYKDTKSNQGWQQVFADHDGEIGADADHEGLLAAAALPTSLDQRNQHLLKRPQVGSRRERRRTSKGNWVFSSYEPDGEVGDEGA